MRAILVFDGDCGMCTTCADLVVRRLRGSPDDYDVAPSQRLDLPSLGLTRQECDESLQWVGAHGACSSPRAGGFGPSGSRPDKTELAHQPLHGAARDRRLVARRSLFTVSHTFRAP